MSLFGPDAWERPGTLGHFFGKDLKVELEPCDILGVVGRGYTSRRIRRLTTRKGQGLARLSHVDVVVEAGTIETAVIVGATRGRVRRRTIAEDYRERRSGLVVYRPLNLHPEIVASILVEVEARAEARERYGFGDILLHLADSYLGGRYAFRRFATDRSPICSGLVAHAWGRHGLAFGIPAGAASPNDIDRFALRHRGVYYGFPLGSAAKMLPGLDGRIRLGSSMAEQLFRKQPAAGSSPARGSIAGALA